MSNREVIQSRAARRAAERAARRDTKPTPRPAAEQLARLDARLGAGVGAVKERERLSSRILKSGSLAAPEPKRSKKAAS